MNSRSNEACQCWGCKRRVPRPKRSRRVGDEKMWDDEMRNPSVTSKIKRLFIAHWTRVITKKGLTARPHRNIFTLSQSMGFSGALLGFGYSASHNSYLTANRAVYRRFANFPLLRVLLCLVGSRFESVSFSTVANQTWATTSTPAYLHPQNIPVPFVIKKRQISVPNAE